jgi:uncharacterized repeat protein (TIGR04052 family)
MAYRLGRWRAAAYVVGFTLAGCDDAEGGGDAQADASVEMQDIELHFEARVGDARAACGQTYSGLGKNQRSLALADMRWYVYDLKLIDERGNAVSVTLPDDEKVQWEQVALLDFEDDSAACENGSADTNSVVRGKVPAGEYQGISFGVGMPPELSHGNPATQKAPLTIQALAWNWRLGHKFLRIDLALEPDGDKPGGGFEVHLGATGCSGQQGSYSCERENTPSIELDHFDSERDKIVFDLAPVLADVALLASEVPGPLAGCTSEHDDPDCEPILASFGLDLQTGKPTTEQRVFRVEAR